MGKPATIETSLMEKVIDSLIEFGSVRKTLLFHDISLPSFFHTLAGNPALDNRYMRAQAAMAELMAEDIVEIADTDTDPQRARNRIDSRKWYAAKTKPQKFGDRIDLNVNQVVDIGSALAEARSRVIDVSSRTAQIAESNKQIPIDASGSQPVDEHAPKKSSDDIFD